MTTERTRQRLIGSASILFAILVWVGWTVSSSYSVRAGLTPYDLTALRFGTAGLCLLPYVWRHGLRIGPWGRWGGVWLAATMGATYSLLTITGMQYAPTSHASGIIVNSMLVLTTLGAVAFLGEHTSKLRVTGIALSLIGIGCLLYAKGHGGEAAQDRMWLGHLLFLAGGTIWAMHALSVKGWKAEPLHVTALVSFWSAVIFLPIYFLWLPSNIHAGNANEAAMQALYQGVLNSILASLCFNRAIRYLGASTTSAFLPLVPVLSTLLAIPVMKEIPQPMEWFGIAIAAVGVTLATGFLNRWIRSHTPHMHPTQEVQASK